MEKTIVIDGKEMRMRATARIPRLYRNEFGEDLIAGMTKLESKFNKKEKEFTIDELIMFENVSWLMLKEAGEEVPPTPDEWLDTLNMFSIMDALPQVLSLWRENNKTTSVPRKK